MAGFAPASSDFNLLDGPPSMLSPRPAAPAPSPPPPPAYKAPVNLRAFGDVPATRAAIYDRVFKAASALKPVQNQKHTLQLSGVEWVDPDNYSKRQRKDAVLRGDTLGRRLRGTWELLDNASGQVLDRKQSVLATIPHLTEGGTFVINGTEYALKNQARLLAGLFAREKGNGEFEAHANVLSGGPAHHYFLDPEKSAYYVRLGQSQIPLMPLLHAMGATDDDMRKAWGDDIWSSNYQKSDSSALEKLRARILKKDDDGSNVAAKLKAAFEGMTLDPEVTKRTLGKPHARLDKDAILDLTGKLLRISRGESEVDDRDHLAFQQFLGPEDLFAERLEKDRAGVRRQLLFKATYKNGLKSLPSSALQSQVMSAILESGLGQALEEINPAEILDKHTQITRMGEGGIPSNDSVPDEARSVQPSHAGYIDPLRTPESERVGVETYLSGNTRKGEGGKLYARFNDARTGQEVWQTPQEVADQPVTFPGAMRAFANNKRVPAITKGRLTWVPKQDVKLVLPPFEHAYSPLNHLVPLKSMLKGQRAAMASRMTTQALPLVDPEAPLVQNAMPGTGGSRSFEDEYGTHMGAIHADQGGRVIATDKENITVQYDDGKQAKLELYDSHPYNRKTFVTQTPTVEPGQRFAPGQLLARSNFTDGNGTTALGLNARVAYMPWGGLNYEDAIVVSESMAKRLSSEHVYQHQLDTADNTKLGKSAYVSLFPARYDKAKLAKLAPNGVIQVGQQVEFGDPLILGAEERERTANKVHRKGQPGHTDVTVTWKHHDPGIVTDVADGKLGPVVIVKSTHPTQTGDKLSGRFGDKGVVAAIIPDDRMPQSPDGQPFEAILNDLGVISRTNPSQWAEAALGKIAAKLGHPIKVEDWDENIPDYTAWVEQQLAAHGLKDREDLFDPTTGRKVPQVYNGVRFLMKLHHTSESKGQGRSSGGYAADETPAKGGETGAKRISMLDVSSLLSHGATDVLRDAGSIRGQRNEDYWLQFMQGYTPRPPRVPLVYRKFVDDLQAAGINVVRRGSQLHLMAMTNKDVDKLAGNREVQSGETVKFDDDLNPIKGGLFDQELTGGHHGNRWSAIKLNEPMPNPAMEEPIRRVLGLTQAKFEDVLTGKAKLQDRTGPAALSAALNGINLDRELAVTRARVKFGNKTDRDDAIRRLGYLKSAKQLEMHPRDWMLNRVPVLPPQFRPVSVMGNSKIPLVADTNYLYRELIDANNLLRDARKDVGDANAGEERLATYNAFKAVVGLGDPVTQASQEKDLKGILKAVFGSSPKYGTVQRRLLSSTVDNVGRAVIAPDPDLDMDTIGLPEDRAFDVYQKFIVRRLRRRGMPFVQAMRAVKDKTDLARAVLLEEMGERPVIANRAPVLHRFGIMAFKPILVKGSVLKISPLVTKGFGADFDGDAMQYHVVGDEAARKEALDRMLPSRQLLSPADFKTPVHVAGQEYIGGLWQATNHKSDRATRTFATSRDVVRAWLHNEIGIGDQVNVLEEDDK